MMGVPPTLGCALSGAYVSLVGTTGEGTRGLTRAPEPQGHPPGAAAVPASGPLQCPTRGERGQRGRARRCGADPTAGHSRRGLAPPPGFPWRGRGLPALSLPPVSPPREGAELGGQEGHEEEGDARRQGQLFPLGARPADALLKLGHLGILSLKVFCGQTDRETGEGGAARADGARGGGGGGGAGT